MAYQKKAKIKRGKDYALQSVWEDMHSGIKAALGGWMLTVGRGSDGVLSKPKNVQVLQARQVLQLLNVRDVVLAKEQLPEGDHQTR